ncbi:MAG: ATP synthase F1 subunit gamma [Chitinispirillaceae bacterium]|nr:ATP synthase F1 subunit gamma [Chitinispirillaceae bacterium]
MPSLSELRKKIRGISSTRQITKAMKMVAGARFSRAARANTDASYYQSELEKVLFAFLFLAGSPKAKLANLYRMPGTEKVKDAGNVGLMVITADKGLCGDFNNSTMREADAFLKKNGDRVKAFFAVGKKAAEHYRNTSCGRKHQYAQFFNKFDFGMADKIGQDVLKAYQEEQLTTLTVVFSHFKSMMKQQVNSTRLLPIEPVQPGGMLYRCMTYEPLDEEEVLATLIPMYLKGRLYSMMRDSYAAELAARMRAMDNATRNAGNLIDTITLEMNKVRQAVITREIAEIIATSEVVK